MPINYNTLLWVFLLFLAVSSIKIVRESQRLVVYRLGRFFGLKGPGLIFIIPGVDKGTKINVGDLGGLLSQDLARIRNADVPVRVVGTVEVGKTVRIQNFMEREAVVVADSADTGWWGRTKASS
jgi:regulator of protease activity HflC (stomatin/prohibitin superfamily)